MAARRLERKTRPELFLVIQVSILSQFLGWNPQKTGHFSAKDLRDRVKRAKERRTLFIVGLFPSVGNNGVHGVTVGEHCTSGSFNLFASMLDRCAPRCPGRTSWLRNSPHIPLRRQGCSKRLPGCTGRGVAARRPGAERPPYSG